MIQSAPTETLQADFKKSLKQREKEKERQPQPDRRKSNYGMSASKLADLKERLNKGKRKVVSPISDPSMLSKKAEPSPSPPPMPTLNALSTSAVPDNKEALKASSLWSLGVHDSLPPLKRPFETSEGAEANGRRFEYRRRVRPELPGVDGDELERERSDQELPLHRRWKGPEPSVLGEQAVRHARHQDGSKSLALLYLYLFVYGYQVWNSIDIKISAIFLRDTLLVE